jgi:Putative MetA-pathway of phenol degradation
LQLGVVGYAYQQISCDTGAGNRLGCFEARVFGAGPQIGHIIPMGNFQGYLNLKGYKEFDAAHRADGWNVWLTFAISPAASTTTAPPKKAVASSQTCERERCHVRVTRPGQREFGPRSDKQQYPKLRYVLHLAVSSSSEVGSIQWIQPPVA